ncbi:hypothetical protein [Streptomyces rubradiris]|uniref:Uncharacterized protein n=1 Tax=Streptomyces rubradiris TaxID=285531 RepID=A0ABQ3RAC3_STRRR|nr:hypothetical protein [Streptomyces rubradiris]GHH25987.1 hypothetical protein GCM10018792_65850 [Streptomyces rubradiris]GHI52790.1 hypothetical protein Srubr_26360 [Streptomyces rubradiris]
MDDYFRDSLANALSLCQYNVRAFTRPEIDAIYEYDDKLAPLGLASYFELETLLDTPEAQADPGSAMRERAKKLTAWHQALTELLQDPRLKNVRYVDPSTTLTSTEDSRSPYSPAVRRFVKGAAAEYHRHRTGFEHAVTVWALGLEAPGSYPPATRHVNLNNKALEVWG